MRPSSLLTAAALMLAAIGASVPAVAQRPAASDALAAFAGSLTALPDPQSLTAKGAVFAPAYSAVRTGTGKGKLEFAVTLSIRNLSEDKPLVLERIDYIDTAGKLVEKYLAQPVAIRPLAAVEIFLPKEDTRGGSSAGFMVGWAAAAPIAEPVIETVMMSSQGNFSWSFVSPGRPVRLLGQ